MRVTRHSRVGPLMRMMLLPIVVLMGVALVAQQPAPEQRRSDQQRSDQRPPDQRPRFAVRTDAVRLDVLVTRDDRPVTGLTADDFVVQDDGVPQKVSLIDRGPIPLDIVLALDLSGSMQGEPMRQVIGGVRALIDVLRPDDRLALLTFSDTFDSFVGLSRDRAAVRTLLARSASGGGTALNDAAFGALMATDPANRTLVMLFTDGVDSASWLTPTAIVDTARRLDVVVYSVTLAQPDPLVDAFFVPVQTTPVSDARPVTSLLPRETGGRHLMIDRANRLGGVFRDIVEEFGQRYLLAYEPAATPKPGWHAISVKLKSGRGRVSARAGYFAESQPRGR